MISLFASACAAPSYYVQAVSGQMKLIRQSEPVDELLADATTDPALANRLATAKSVREFATGRLGLPESDAYRRYAETGREAVTWIVAAAPEFSLRPRTWCFLFAGCVPYRGYFEAGDAERFAARLGDKGYDTMVAPATAYSTLGWFDDPLLDTMFVHGDTQFAATLFHEMAHLALYVKNDAAFNESFASFVEETGVRLWLESRNDAEAFKSWRARRERSEAVDGLFDRYREALQALYASGASEPEMRAGKQNLLDGLCAAIEASRPDVPGGGGAARCDLNNASFSLRQAYHGGRCAFDALYRQAGGDMHRFIELATERSRQSPDAREAWLSSPCGPVAPDVDL